MTSGRGPRDPRHAGIGIVVALGLAGLVLGGALAIALRGGSGVSLAPVSLAPLASVEPSAVASSASRGPSSSASAPPTSAVPLPPSGTRARIDSSLLAVLPPTIGGLAVREFPEGEQQAAGDANLGQNVVRFATAFVGDANGANWAYVAVVDLRPGAGTDAFYRDWRDSFDTSACARAGGVAGHSTIVIAGRSIERSNCGSRVRTYHALVIGTNLLVSVSDFGDAQFGQLVLGALTP